MAIITITFFMIAFPPFRPVYLILVLIQNTRFLLRPGPQRFFEPQSQAGGVEISKAREHRPGSRKTLFMDEHDPNSSRNNPPSAPLKIYGSDRQT